MGICVKCFRSVSDSQMITVIQENYGSFSQDLVCESCARKMAQGKQGLMIEPRNQYKRNKEVDAKWIFLFSWLIITLGLTVLFQFDNQSKGITGFVIAALFALIFSIIITVLIIENRQR